uniref:Phospholipid:diacylglycerol acyltransferase n=2 Tax=Erythrolobus australicus TaxID=1077150 RepID=A0A7S1TL63_9RHOD
MDMVRQSVRNGRCWLAHVGLQLDSWADPIGIELRPAESFAASDYLFPGYWVWSKMITALADVGYDSRSMSLVAYDWRLSPAHAQERDALFLQVKQQVERMNALSPTQGGAVLVAHSMGSLWVLYFLRWAERECGAAWVDRHIHAVLNIAGPLLGVPKALSAALSGEMRDNTAFGRLSRAFNYAMFGSDANARLARYFRSIGSLPSMFPTGSVRIWDLIYRLGFSSDAQNERDSMPQDAAAAANSETQHKTLAMMSLSGDVSDVHYHPCAAAKAQCEGAKNASCEPDGVHVEPRDGNFEAKFSTNDEFFTEQCVLSRRHFHKPNQAQADRMLCEPLLDNAVLEKQLRDVDFSVENYTELFQTVAPRYMERVREHYEHLRPRKKPSRAHRIASPLLEPPIESGYEQLQLPRASSVQIYCMYGVLDDGGGVSTEYGYHFAMRGDLNSSTALFEIDTEKNDDAQNLRNGIRLGPGDGTVPLPSLAYPCWRWRQPKVPRKQASSVEAGSNLMLENPAGCPVRIREYRNGEKSPGHPAADSIGDGSAEDLLTLIRGGAFAATHVEILGHREILYDTLQIVTAPKRSAEREQSSARAPSERAEDERDSGNSADPGAHHQRQPALDDMMFSKILNIFAQGHEQE